MTVKIKKGDAAGLINLTPMIDVVFQLLLFFMVASRFADEEQQLKLPLPQASAAAPLTKKLEALTVNVDREGHFFANGKIMNKVELERLIRQSSANNPGRQSVVLRADKRTPWEFVVVVQDLCTKHNIRDFRAQTAPIGKESPPAAG